MRGFGLAYNRARTADLLSMQAGFLKGLAALAGKTSAQHRVRDLFRTFPKHKGVFWRLVKRCLSLFTVDIGNLPGDLRTEDVPTYTSRPSALDGRDDARRWRAALNVAKTVRALR